jgi:catalase
MKLAPSRSKHETRAATEPAGCRGCALSQDKTLKSHEGKVVGSDGAKVSVDARILTRDSVMYDAVYVPGGPASVTALQGNADFVHFVRETYKHYKSVASSGQGRALVQQSLGSPRSQPGVVNGASVSAVAGQFLAAITKDRHWPRQGTNHVAA